jgi:hypothetical protein
MRVLASLTCIFLLVGSNALVAQTAKPDVGVPLDRKEIEKLGLAVVPRNEKVPPACASRTMVQRVTEETIDTAPFVNRMSLKDAIGLLYEIMSAKGTELPILIDTEAFKRQDKDAVDPYETAVSLPPVPRRMTVEKALRLMLPNVPNAAFVVRRDFVEITTEKEASLDMLLKQGVLGDFSRRRFSEVISELAARHGITIIIDEQQAAQANKEISATFRNDVALRDAIVVLARSAALHAEFLPTAVFITSARAEGKRP